MLAAIGVLLLVMIIALAAASFFAHMLAAAIILTALPVAAVLIPLVGAYETLFALATVAIIGCLIHTISDTFKLARAPGRTAASSTRRPS